MSTGGAVRHRRIGVAVDAGREDVHVVAARGQRAAQAVHRDDRAAVPDRRQVRRHDVEQFSPVAIARSPGQPVGRPPRDQRVTHDDQVLHRAHARRPAPSRPGHRRSGWCGTASRSRSTLAVRASRPCSQPPNDDGDPAEAQVPLADDRRRQADALQADDRRAGRSPGSTGLPGQNTRGTGRTIVNHNCWKPTYGCSAGTISITCARRRKLSSTCR